MQKPRLREGCVMGPLNTQCTSELDFDSKSVLYVGHALSPVTGQGHRGTAGLSGNPWDDHAAGQLHREEPGHRTLEEKSWRKPPPPTPRPGPGQRAAASPPSQPWHKVPECLDPLKEKSICNCFFDQGLMFHFREESQWTQQPVFSANPFSPSVCTRGHSENMFSKVGESTWFLE